MKRFRVRTEDGYSMLLYYPTEADAKSRWPGAEVEEYDDFTYLDGIQLIKDNAQLMAKQPGISLFRMDHADGEIHLKLIHDPEDGLYYDIVRYKQYKIGAYTEPVTWSISSVMEFVDDYINREPMCFIPVSERRYGQKKLKKPEELNGQRKSFSVDFIPGKCRCECYVHGDDLWIKHHDYFSPTWRPPIDDIGKPTSYYLKKYFGIEKPEKFIYPDTWGAIVLRSEAWIKLENLIPTLQHLSPQQISRRIWELILQYYGWSPVVQNADWERFLENAAAAAADYLKQRKEQNNGTADL